jgi:hypothetical protein
MDLPIIIFHIGNQPYVHSCLKQASKFNNNVIVLNEHDNMFPNINVKCVNYKKYSTYLTQFKSLYKHYSTNSYQLEFICIVRWMCIYEYMKKHKIKRAFICDSDVLIYDNITMIDKKYLHEYEFMLCSSPSKNLTGGQCIFNFEILQRFIIFIFKFYKTQISIIDEWWNKYKQAGGICDMTLLYYFAHKQDNFVGLRIKDKPYFNCDLTKIFNNEFTFDLHLAANGNHLYPTEYEINKETNNKNIKFINGVPYCYNTRVNKNIRFVLLHFQGKNKRIMNKFFQLNNT